MLGCKQSFECVRLFDSITIDMAYVYMLVRLRRIFIDYVSIKVLIFYTPQTCDCTSELLLIIRQGYFATIYIYFLNIYIFCTVNLNLRCFLT